ncbi:MULTISPECIES: DapH/DapD/GlmU-related protein [unclassified Bacillus (in: firmicutes)]|uniref:acyltransferase n=1 Tax=unclassified Bacillus (in: firmicutes) TaxID=185979 RepID=UPI0008E1327C|nr:MULTISPECIES: acyltransferase [unclassified Bacillus (in: firmicutes)]SFB04753.1 Hexapeptide repeat of succinyl-transferase [Bacillus sp. UNCCL13]SFQ88415.1 Hexapeptide repeat of succinyl-transferase [Bacillus sp. cl95]
MFFDWIYKKNLGLKIKLYKKMLNAQDKNLRIFGPLVIKSPDKINIGCNCKLNDFVFLHGGGGLCIEDYVTISAFAKVISYSYDTSNWPENYLKKEHISNHVHIGKGTWIGAGAIILPGVKITGEGVIVAAGSVVTKDIAENFVLVGGSPAKVLKRYV